MYYEFKKLYIKQKWILLLLLFICLKIISLCFQGYDSYYTIDIYEEKYEKYMKQYSGQLTYELEKLIQREYYNINHADAIMEELNQGLKDGTLSEDDYIIQYQKLNGYKQNKDIFTIIYSKYKYALENSKEHYILDSRGWETMLTHDKGDYMLLLGVIILTTLVFCYEYESNMELILLTSRNGKYLTGMFKLITAIISAIIMTIIFKIIEWLYLMFTVGLEHGDYPLQSIEFFKNTSYNIPLWQAYLLVIFLQVLGVVLFTLFISFFSLLLKNKVATFVSGCAFMLLPMIVFMGKSALYRIVLPFGFIKATGYLWGSKYAYRFNAKGVNVRYCSFEAVSKGKLELFLIYAMIEILVIGLLCMTAYSNSSIKIIFRHKLGGKIKKVSIFILCLSMLGTMCSGCSNYHKGSYNDYIYNSNDRFDQYDYKDNKIYLDESDNSIKLKSYDGVITSLNRDIYNNESTTILSICVYEDNCYYMSVDEENICRIYKISLQDYQESLLYRSESENEEDFFGLLGNQEIDNDWYAKQVLEYSYFFVDGNYIYIVENNSLVRINKKLGISHTIINDLGDKKEICYIDGKIYYVSMEGNIKVYDQKDQNIETTHMSGKEIRILDGILYYTNIMGKKNSLSISN